MKFSWFHPRLLPVRQLKLLAILRYVLKKIRGVVSSRGTGGGGDNPADKEPKKGVEKNIENWGPTLVLPRIDVSLFSKKGL